MGEVGEGTVCLAVSTDGEMENDGASKTELKRDRLCLVDSAEVDPFPNKKQAKEFSSDDIRSEVTNPVISPKENTSSFQDITSQPAVLANGNHLECGEVTSTCSENSSSEETLSNDGEPDGNRTRGITTDTCGSVVTSRVVLEIPKHVSSSGIRKITFKFSKRKEDDDVLSPASVAQPVTGGFGGGYVHGGFSMEPRRDLSSMVSETNNFHLCAPNLELKMSKKVVPGSYPTNVKKLLATGILDGARVKYVFGTPKVYILWHVNAFS